MAAAPVAAVRNLSFSIAAGEVLGLVGESGSGKSVTSLAIMGLLPPAAKVRGEITFQNGERRAKRVFHATMTRISLRQLRGSRIAMIFQEPMTALNPVMRVGDQIAEAVLAHHRVSEAGSLAAARSKACATLPFPIPSSVPAAIRTSFLEACASA